MSDLKKMYHEIVQDGFPDNLTISFGDTELSYAKRVWEMEGEARGLRYGENPDQPAAVYEYVGGQNSLAGKTWRAPGQGIVSSIREEDIIQSGKHPGKINLTDVDNGVNILQYLTARPAAIILKHNNPSGAAWADSLDEALSRAFWADRIAAFGGAVVVNRPLAKSAAEFINSQYFEVVAAPEYEPGAVEILKNRKNLRIFRLPDLGQLEKLRGIPFLDIKSLTDGGLILQQSFVNRIRTAEDFLPASGENKDGQMVTARKPGKREAEDLLFAWAVEAGVTSNSVVFAKNGVTVAIGTGEQDRVGCVELAIHKAYAKYADTLAFTGHQLSIYELQLKALQDRQAADLLARINERTRADKAGLPGASLVSDGFFPFRDGVDVAIAQGITAVAQPGGSIRDFEVITACNEAVPQVAMVFTGQRSFKH